MTNFNKATLAATFAQGDIPQGSDFSNLIYSQVNLVETVTQSMAGPLSATELNAPLVSAANANFTGTVSAGSMNVGGSLSVGSFAANNVTLSGTTSANALFANSITVNTDVSANGTIYASAVRSSNWYSPPIIITATGTALATATSLTGAINRVQGVVDGQTTGVKLLANRAGLEQVVINETAVSANLWPAGSDFRINAMTSGAAFPLAANTPYNIFYTTASAAWVK